MSHPLRSILAVAAVALVLPALAAAQEPPPDELPPPPPTTAPVEPPEPEPEPTTITIQVPPLAEEKPAPAKAAAPPAQPKPQRERARRAAPTRSSRTEETSSEPVSAPREVEPVREPPARRRAKPPRRTRGERPKPRVVAQTPLAAAPGTIRDREAPAGVLAAQYGLSRAGGGDAVGKGIPIVALLLACLLGAAAGVVGAAPLLEERWPAIFVPVLQSGDRIVFAGICVAGGVLALVLTWALTGPGT